MTAELPGSEVASVEIWRWVGAYVFAFKNLFFLVLPDMQQV